MPTTRAALCQRAHEPERHPGEPWSIGFIFDCPVPMRRATSALKSKQGLPPPMTETVVTDVAQAIGGPSSTAPVAGPGDVERQLELLAAIARRTANAVIVTEASGRIEWVNDGFTRLTGFALAEAVGRRPSELLQGPDTAPATLREMSQAIAAQQPFDVVVLNYAKSGQQYWVRIEAQPTVDRAGNVTGYIAIETDVSEVRIAAGREAVTKQVGDGLLVCASIEEAAKLVTTALTSTLDVRAAQVWLVEPGQEHLRWVTGMSADDDGRDWVAAGAAQTFRRGDDWVVGVGAPGMAWGTARPCIKSDFWITDANGQHSRRSAAAQRARIRTVCAVPVVGPDGVVAVIEIGGSHNYPGHERLPGLVEQVAQQFAAFILQHESRSAFQALFRHSPDALLLVDAAGVVERVNARAHELFGAVRGQKLHALLDDVDVLLEAGAPAVDTVVIHTRQGRSVAGARFSAEVTVSSTTAAATTAAPMRIVAVRDLTERHRAEAALKRSLEEKQTLVQEVHHRVKNNLQIISSLVSLQAAELDGEEVRAALQDTSNRIQSMALVHQQIYGRDDLARIEFDDYARTLCTTLRGSLAPDAVLSVEAVPVELPIERAVPCGLILNELLTNAFKHGRRNDGTCAVHVVVERTTDGFSFSVADEGPGLSSEPARRGSMGQTLIKALVRQLRATRTITVVGGTRIRIDVPDDAR
jgi:PAS domain S-box-containing protein